MPSDFDALDHIHMAHALRLAERGLNTTQPNPRVGCVIAHGEEVVGEGWHERAGQPHAEVHALREAGECAKDATAYVTLEPCAHHGRTPPCADALVAAGVARVVIAAEDPNPQVDGRGIERLREACITVESGLMREPARDLNIGFFHRLEHGRPFVRVKLAMSLDGRTALADGTSKWITGEAARNDVQRWRARSSAILTGSGTALADNPRLTVRLTDVPHIPPLRVVLDRSLRTPDGAHLLEGSAPTLFLHGSSVQPDLRFAGVDCVAVPESGSGLDLEAVMTLLAGREVNEVHVEAGPTLCGALFAAGLVDELLLYVAPVLLGDLARPLLKLPALTDMSLRWGLEVLDRRAVGDDLRLRLRPSPRS
ncbi:bifunctional diaminohydroxyphosphoribosylaminopyrimidine deaminase/5-amino-6-(5-phosphoribosylamino)uracil reductase RibD [Oleiagrimonas sp.]|jgi:diaminohydroxyphosphoribosylaminopyrimidine deaminase/5-amino-6-(5-phosphoribosylamino)uracil reductase|uniref:bifunctional diaminohydroxyphosphoribosylaminopyrimidine deaminase/5-amino-6-(5-phosphoribosylamino)uracil reductase RibD n=1 Tax=Oleiagrimonas sp. TaxID=2010330 RepID=UPI002602C242|nr:bifunctional diaminohydroxyphosphoribosylaminopyrimidine deaminase/5-amino-6-(5-phosphoribosylamino)uracil reductase RibD [Oleiagrimonas sp.]MDA3915335.1 bifunctional diaminohydroxyphosphoribosylaminopyrimidine deaminase/5-amino-6-(5-phosphoribosylamino)uracil reductase RibD [Oleiagrimonas sp.]